ncbi:hypothetical protein BSK49_01060 [Paenibacillus odorifer]|uniref:hypothetical protein n=1 Tax=Paenibacillus TaxID=44249 RepID=UPI00096CD2E2|nr:hypothetical protein [Paenibacillus odorifer]OMD93003.1 hypothetical protein BSK49_01060 [Paenibacillus odorifer]
MAYEFYITPEEYEKAAENGIKRGTLEWRIRDAAWDRERAVTTPPRALRDRSQWVKVAAANDIPYPIFINRVNTGWTPERAATQPVRTKEQLIEQMKESSPVKRKYPEELIKQAASNGISRNTFHVRVHNGWSWERAASEPPVSLQERGRRGAESLHQKYGDIHGLIFQKRG